MKRYFYFDLPEKIIVCPYVETYQHFKEILRYFEITLKKPFYVLIYENNNISKKGVFLDHSSNLFGPLLQITFSAHISENIKI